MKTVGNEEIEITCANCNAKVRDWKDISAGEETSYECLVCGYKDYAHEYNTRIKE